MSITHDLGVSAPAGFRSAGVAAGIKSTGARDLALVVNDGPSDTAAAVFTSNRCQAHPVIWSKQAIADYRARAIVLNSGGANCYTGPAGFITTHRTAEKVAELLEISAFDVLVCSTGLIGAKLPEEKVLAGCVSAAGELTAQSGVETAQAIMTTDSVHKIAEYRSEAGWSIGGMAKGAGMLAPALATMLVVITTDVTLTGTEADDALRSATALSFDRLDSDGCQSTNDTVALLCSGAHSGPVDLAEFTRALTALCQDLAQQLLRDAEGADHDIAITVTGAHTEPDAIEVGRSIARSNLFKAAIFGKDPNWGRVLAAVGTTSAHFDPLTVDVAMNGVWVCRDGAPSEDPSAVNLDERAVSVIVDLKAGEYEATIYTNDLTHAYVHENSAYSS